MGQPGTRICCIQVHRPLLSHRMHPAISALIIVSCSKSSKARPDHHRGKSHFDSHDSRSETQASVISKFQAVNPFTLYGVAILEIDSLLGQPSHSESMASLALKTQSPRLASQPGS